MKIWLKKLIKWLKSRRNHITPLVNIYINKQALLHNLNEFRKIIPNGQVATVLKSNAYGHGLSLIAKELEKEQIPFFIIDSYFEARALRNEGIKTPLLIIGFVKSEDINNCKLKNTSFTIGSIDLLKEIKSKTKIHLKIDTGMHRQGILPEEIKEAIEIIKNNKNIEIEGICSHFADADNIDTTFTEKQISLWNNIVENFKRKFTDLKYWHISNTAGHKYKEAKANLTRLGLGLYGIADIKELNLKPVLEMKTIISGIKKIKKGDIVGYGCSFITTENMTIATIPLGYYEGINRRLSNKGIVKIANNFCPIIGKVSMNITTIDISKLNNIKIGDEVIVISNKKEDRNSIENISRDCDIIPYEIAVYIPAHLKRIII